MIPTSDIRLPVSDFQLMINNSYFAMLKTLLLEYLLFVAYLVLFAWLVTKTRFFKKTGLSNPQLVIIFLLKVIAGIFYGWMGHFYGGFAQMLDTWVYHHNSLIEYQILRSN